MRLTPTVLTLALGLSLGLVPVGCASGQSREEEALEAVELYRRGRTLYDEGEFEQALRLFQQVIEQEPTYSMARLYAAVIQFNKGMGPLHESLRLEFEANRLLDEGGQENANRAEQLQVRGRDLEQQALDHFEAARPHLDFLYQNRPDHRETVSTMLGWIHANTGNYNQAIDYFQEALHASTTPENRERLRRAIQACEEGIIRRDTFE